jgi:hypothetical protein
MSFVIEQPYIIVLFYFYLLRLGVGNVFFCKMIKDQT